MTFTIAWDHPAEVVFKRVPWPTSAEMDAEIQRFAADRAPALASGEYRFRTSGYVVGVRVDRTASTVLVLYVYRRL